ncbi:hypothetical protein [Paenibacillus sp. DCT19]|uniref:hypothetical protein n=1 Tax=Paenibacillus sp. DCT19 TaxID=2211212 RepID=UPI000FE1C23C|nr:hypothetical protein [Paenibacillus sp. DCT19]
MSLRYEAYGLHWISQIHMPELRIVPSGHEPKTKTTDVYIQSTDLTPLWESWDVGDSNFVCRDGSLFFG